MSIIQRIHTNSTCAREYCNTSNIDFTLEDRQKFDMTASLPGMQIEHIDERKKLVTKAFGTWPLDSLIDYILTVHHWLSKENAAIIYDLAQKVAYRHSETHPELSKLVMSLFLFLDDLLYHLKHEEQMLLGEISELLKNKNNAPEARKPIEDAANSMKRQLMVMAAALKDFRELTNDFTPPEGACHCHRDLFIKMKRFENDLSLHFLIKNEVLFPKALLLDERSSKTE